MTSFATFRFPAPECALLGLGVTLCLLLAASSVLSGCASSAPAASAVENKTSEAHPAVPRIASTLRAEVQAWEGTPYRMGGTTRRGVDCSGFMQRLYRDALDVELSRSTRTQVREGRRIARSELRPGDLVFFRPARKTRHVGVYVGEGEFAHASTSEGVTITPLANSYWQDAYWTARRVLQPAAPAPLAAEVPPAAPKRAPARAGW